ncbi:MAG: histidine--tRNA ligase [Gammaproteobacteria bacterium]|nr:histidine--tRNA ligase [Gammaproteobacteria bacterium]
MSEILQSVRGMSDVLPAETSAWQAIESLLKQTMQAYGYQELRVPLVERTELFKRSIGEVTDIVEKEMYTFEDRNGESLTLRPEGTAGVVRAGISNGLLHNQRQKVWYTGPMFRYEKPQKGRYRQFHQFGAEALGFEGPDVDAEMIIMSARIWQALGLDKIELQINSLGTAESRGIYKEKLLEYFLAHEDELDADSQNRLHRNPMRILDTKNPAMADLVAAAPQITDYLDDESREHFAVLKALLDQAGIAYKVNPRLVRGLDYYSRTVFEWVTDQLGAQGAVCSGGRYDGLVEQLGGKPTAAIGWAIGLERLIALCEELGCVPVVENPHVYIVLAGEAALKPGFLLAEQLRDALPGVRIEANCGGGSFKSQFKRADKSGAQVALVLGAEEIEAGVASIKPLRSDNEQQSVPLADLAGALATELGLQ